ncbi:MAG: 6,7-dimethyl-8-ribityllumazine synthase [Bacteroidetes bacterium]|nr:MAG: 6,7-dimethyl-8-ribityllumazine synthase [Bacteroidota bacterium]
MATSEKNLSLYNIDDIPSAEHFKIGLVVSKWNHDITSNLYQGALEVLLKHGASEANIFKMDVPGAFELPLGAQWLIEKRSVDGVICLGSVIRGETKHFDFVCEAAAMGIKDVGLKFSKPVIFGVLTDNNKQQAIDRSGGKHGNKGVEAAVALLQMLGNSEIV